MGLLVTTGAAAASSICMPSNSMISSGTTGVPGLFAVLSTWTSSVPSSANLGGSFTSWSVCLLTNSPPASTSKFTDPNCLVIVPSFHHQPDLKLHNNIKSSTLNSPRRAHDFSPPFHFVFVA